MLPQHADPSNAGRETMALFVDDEELRHRINPKIGRDRFRAMVRELELSGFPKIHSLFRGRYWPAVAAWLDADNGIGKHSPNASVEDGPEDWDGSA
jgi:hypothetical protein